VFIKLTSTAMREGSCHVQTYTDSNRWFGIVQYGDQKRRAKVTGLTVTVPYHYFAVDAVQLSDTPEQYAKDIKIMAEKNLSIIKEEAIKAGISFDLIHRSNAQPYEEIVKTAQDFMCDVIFQASHGRRGMSGFLLGSETQKVLTHSKIPVLVYR
jgi:nucleotide-binding universal stress UspA family protein